MFTVTQKAAHEIKKLLSEEGFENAFLRVRIIPGGCSGFSYEMGFDDEFEDIDANISSSATRVQSSPFTPRQRFIYNRDSRTRDTIIFGKPIDWDNDLGGAYYFDELTVEQLEQLVNQQFADPAERQNFSPTLGEFLAFAQTQKSKGFEFRFEGYVISPKREDYRVSIDGLQFQGDCSYQVITDFHAIAYNADELDIDPNFLRAWWD